MRIQCPSCDAKLRVAIPDDDTRIECPKCGVRFRVAEAEDDDDDDEAPSRKKRGKKSKGDGDEKGFPVGQVVGISTAGILAVGAVVFVVMGRPKEEPKPAPEAAAVTPSRPETPPQPNIPRPQPQVPRPNVTPNLPAPAPKGNPRPGRPSGDRPEPKEETPEPLAELFRTAVDRPPPTIKAATLDRDADALPLDVPTFYSLRIARQPAKAAAPKAIGKLTLDDLKKATTFIKVEAGDLSGSGSGFLIGLHPADGSGVVATNYHVIEAAAGPKTEGTGSTQKITVVFNSGEASGEQELPAKIVAFDPIADLAILSVPGGSFRFPKPIDPWATPPQLKEETDVRICGFPLGSLLATGGQKNPSISINPGTISSLRRNKEGKLEKVQISGSLNPGNSGGPIVDKDGRLVGIAVSIIKREIAVGIGFAVPVNDLIALLEGRLLTTIFVPVGLENGAAKFQVIVPIMDPLDKIRKVYVRYWTGLGEPPKGVKDKNTGWKPIERAEQIELKLYDTGTSLAIATGELRVPQSATKVVLQIASESMDKQPFDQVFPIAASPPVSYKLTLADIKTGSDARPFSELTQNPEALAGKVIVVRGRVLSPPARRGETPELIVAGPDGTRPAKLRFLTSREIAPHFDDVEREHQPMPARLTCVVGTRGSDGVIPVRVARVDFIGRGDQVVRSIPEETTDQLAALNRDPAKFAGQNLQLTAHAVPMTPRTASSPDLYVIFANRARPRSLAFVMVPGMNQKIVEQKLRPNKIEKVRLTVTVGDLPNQPDAPVKVTVSKIEILDPKDGQVVQTIE
jgi:S1-C subfamily serine protease